MPRGIIVVSRLTTTMRIVALCMVAVLGLMGTATWVGVAVIERAHPAKGRMIDVAGGRLHVVELGPADRSTTNFPVILLHGASVNLNDLRPLGERLSGARRVILVDRPGHGWSERSGADADSSPARQAAMIAEALDKLGVDRLVLVGHSWSGALATRFALEHPERVAGLALLAPVTHPWPGGIAWHYNVGSAPIFGPLIARTLALPIGLLLLEGGARVVFAPQELPEDYVRRSAIRLMLRPHHFLANARDVADLKAFVAAQAERYRELAMPTVIITGERDRTVSPLIHSRALAAAVPHAKLILLADVGHMPHHAVPDLVAAEIERVAEAANPAK